MTAPYTSSANSPAVDISDYLSSSSIGLGLVEGTDLFISQMPEHPNNCVCVYDTGGPGQDLFGYEMPSIQILVRNLAYTTGYALARDIKYILTELKNLTINNSRYILIRPQTEIFAMGKDDKERFEWSLNFQIQRSGI